MKTCIFSYANFQIERPILAYHQAVINKLKPDTCVYEFLNYNAPDGQIVPDQVIDYALRELFFQRGYDTVLILDIDCVPLSKRALTYTLKQAQRKLIGNIQRSNHIENNQHVFVAPSCLGLSKSMFLSLGAPSFAPTRRGDIGEELTYIAEQRGIDVEMFLPGGYEAMPYDSKEPWNLTPDLPKYGIGTTFVDAKHRQMFYHLFQSRVGVFNEYFYTKCKALLD